MGKKSDAGPKLPKRIAGVKVPKKLRKAGGRLLAEATAPATIELVAGALAIGASALRDGATKAGAPGKDDAAPARDATLSPLAGLAASALAGWIGRAASTMAAQAPHEAGAPPKPH